jgi:Rubrerythrin
VNPSEQDLRRYQDNFLREQDGIALYRALAKAEKDPARAEIFEKLATAEERHAARWPGCCATTRLLCPYMFKAFFVEAVLPVRFNRPTNGPSTNPVGFGTHFGVAF